METTLTTNRKLLRGVVTSDKMQDTAVVSVQRYVKHPKYKKYMKQNKKYHVHNPGNRAKEGDQVTIRSCRPLSKTKSFEIVFEN
ncbi:MAG: 30S ribosomal protein S17 [Candidatus Adlerbacteria bacterium]|nr:30S ribosomal protein S17 [Candidatus Adlerbacteria bacterium]